MNKIYTDKSTCSGAASRGHLELLKWLLVNGCECPEYIMTNAACSGNREMILWLRLIRTAPL